MTDYLNIGDRATGRPVNIGDWSGNLPRYARGTSMETGVVIGTNLQHAQIVRIRTKSGEEFWIRRALRVIDRRPYRGQPRPRL